MNSLTLYKWSNKERVGSQYDGGYVIQRGHSYDLFISCGISDDITFELDFINKNSIRCMAYDGTIENIPASSDNAAKQIRFFKKNIGIINSDKTTNLHN